jgi:hypothetical protein
MRHCLRLLALLRPLRGVGGLLALALVILATPVNAPAPFDFGLRAAHAQWWGDDRDPWGYGRGRARPRYQAPPARSFFGLFDWGRQPEYREMPEQPRPQKRVAPADYSKAPPPRKLENPPDKTVLVLGDSMADWLGSGLEDAFAEANEFGVVRKVRAGSGLIHNEPREYDWAQVARETLAAEKPAFVVMMLGLSDRRAIREHTQNQPADKPAPGRAPKKAAERAGAVTSYDFRSDAWSEHYAQRLDEVIAVLKSKRVPVLWVGLPPIRGARARVDVTFLNDIYKAEAGKNDIVYVDVWDGFVDDAGEFSYHGPDVLGQVRRLRTGDGVYFTKAGARKLAHYVDREIKRLMNRETPVALPMPGDLTPAAAPGQPSGPAPRPVAGPVIPLTGGVPETETVLLGGRGGVSRLDPDATKVLVKGETLEPVQGRADNSAWPRQQALSENDMVAPPPVAAVRPVRRPAATTSEATRTRAASGSAPSAKRRATERAE